MRVSFAKIETVRRNPPAFTLIEVLVGAVIFMLMAVLLMAVLSQINNAWQQVQGQKARRESARIVFGLLNRDLQGAIPALPGTGSNAVAFQLLSGFGNASSEALFWQTALPVSRSKSDVATVGYFLSEDYKLYRMYTNSPVNGFQGATNTVGGTNDTGLVAENILRMTVSFINKDGSTNSATASYETNLPSAADITLLVSDARTLLQHPSLGVPDVNNPPSGVQVFRTRIDIPAGQ